MKKTLTAFAAAIILVLLLPACKNDSKKMTTEEKAKAFEEKVKDSPTVNAGTGTFSINAPEGWTKKDTTLMGFQTVLLMSTLEPGGDLFQENINVLTEKTGDMTLEKYLDLSYQNIGKMLSDYKLKEEKNLEIDGQPAKSLSYSHKMSGFLIDVNAVFLIKNGIAYVITSSVEGGAMNKWKTDIDKALASFHVN